MGDSHLSPSPLVLHEPGLRLHPWALTLGSHHGLLEGQGSGVLRQFVAAQACSLRVGVAE